MAKTFSGFNEETAKNLLLDAGAYYLNYDIDADTPEMAKSAGKLLGATRGGGQFDATPEIRQIEIDGVKGRAKGLSVIDSWEVKMVANVLEVTKEGLARALTASTTDTTTNLEYDIIKAKNDIDLTDYIENITYIGKISGAEEPLIIQIYNAINTTGLTLQTQDKAEAVIAMEFQGHYDTSELDNPPFAIFYPKTTSDTTPPTVTVSPTDGETGVAVTAEVAWTFSEAIKTADVTDSNFFLNEQDGANVDGTLSLSADKTTVTFKPAVDLTAATDYVAIVTKNVRDISGNKLASNSVTNFTTA